MAQTVNCSVPKEFLSPEAFPRHFRKILPNLKAKSEIEYEAFLCFADGLEDERIGVRLRISPPDVRAMRHRFLLVRDVARKLILLGRTSIPVDISEYLDWEGYGCDGNTRPVSSPPGSRLWKLAEFFCTKKTYTSVFCPLLADFHYEYFEALKDRREWKARWLRVLYCGAFLKSAGLNVAMRFLREAWARFKSVTP